MAAILGALLFASSVPSPLYPVYQDEWGFSDVTLASVFAVYAIALLAALLVVGSISDHVGRRPVLIAALTLQIVSMVAFAGATEVGWLFCARILQGLATGTAIGTLSAALLDLEPPSRPDLGALMGVVAPLSGLALGALVAGLLAEYGPDPTRFVFWLLTGGFAVALLAVIAAPETVRPDGGWRASLRPRVAVPAPMRAAFYAALPAMGATWALGGLFLSLGASLTDGVLGESSQLAAALPIFVIAGVSALASIRLQRVSPRTTARGGLLALIAGIGVALVALFAESNPLFLFGSAIAGLGFGPSFAGIFRDLSNRAPEDERAGLLSAIFVVSYLAFSLPAIAAGAAVAEVGLEQTAEAYAVALIAIASVALGLTGRLGEEDQPTVA